MADPNQILDLLRSFPFLADQPEPLLQTLAVQGQLLRFNLGQPISRLDQAPPQVFFLLQGTVRSVVMAQRFAKGVATLQLLQTGAVMGWSLLSCGKNYEILLASSDLVVLALPNGALREAMAAHKPLADRVQGSVAPAELFAVLDAHLRDYPRVLTREVLEAAVQLVDSTRAIAMTPDQIMATEYPADRLWITSTGSMHLGSVLPPAQRPQGDGAIRVLGIDRVGLARILDPPATDGVPLPSRELLVDRWEEQRRKLDITDEIPIAPDLSAEDQEEPESEEKRTARSYPWFSGVGPLNSPIAAFRMLSEHLRLPFRRELLRRVFSDHVRRHGEASLALSGAVAESLGLQTQLLEVQTSAINRLETPLLIKWGNGLAVIYRTGAKSLIIGIPAASNQELTLEEFEEQWGEEGEVLTLKVNELTPQRKFGFSWFLPSIVKHRVVLIEVLLASFFVQLFGLVNPLLIQQVIDKVIIQSNRDSLGVLGLLLVVFAVFEGLLLCLRTFLFIDTTNRIDLSLGTEIIDHLLRLPLSYFDRRPVGEVSSRISELEKIRGFLTGTALTTILDAVFSLIYIVVMLMYSWELTILTLAVIPVLVGLTLVVSPIVRQKIQTRAIANGKTQSHLIEVLSSMITVKAQNIELRSRWKWQDLYTDFIAEGFDNTIISTIANTLGDFLNKLSSLLLIWAGASFVLEGKLSLGELIAFRMIAGYVTGPILRMTSIWQSVQETALSLERLSDVIDHPQEAPPDNANRIIMPPIEGNIEFQNIKFRYKPSSPLLLKGVNLEIPKGKFVAVVGTSGSGKSTLTKLLARLYQPEAGTVLVDSIDISKVELYSLRRQIGIVPQETVLFDGSVEENITLTNPEASPEEIIEASKIACAHDFIMDLSAGYSTEVGERGGGLSGGQRQRIAIARTILQKPRMLIMDEATSALDYQTERVVSENLMQNLKGCTVLFITHRLSSIVNADMIVCMGNGTVLEAGTHQELMAARGPYFVLFRQQGKSSSSSASPAKTSLAGSAV
jgi:ATP-binding cassette, subfamily B, bacterial HlyB/CyaB